MDEKQYTIGKFAALNKITPRMLRHYDAIGLLKPSVILENGYRAYVSSQIQIVSNIRNYQNCCFSLSEIGELLYADEDEIRKGAKRKLTQLELQEKTNQLARDQLIELAEFSTQILENSYDISFVEQSKQLLFGSKAPIVEADVEMAIDQLFDVLDSLKVTSHGHLLLRSNVEEHATYHVAIPVAAPIDYEGYCCTVQEAGWFLSTFHYGDYHSIGMAYDKLFCYAKKKGYRLKQPFLERYLLDGTLSASKAQYVTQILIELIS